jgi:hypothetical protein
MHAYMIDNAVSIINGLPHSPWVSDNAQVCAPSGDSVVSPVCTLYEYCSYCAVSPCAMQAGVTTTLGGRGVPLWAKPQGVSESQRKAACPQGPDGALNSPR